VKNRRAAAVSALLRQRHVDDVAELVDHPDSLIGYHSVADIGLFG